MNEIETYQAQLPDTIEDLTKFVLIGRAKLDAYKLKLQTVSKLTDAQTIRDQTIQDMQDVSIAIIAAEQRIGEIMLSIQKAQGKRNDLGTSSGRHDEVKTKTEIASEQGYSRNQVSECQRLAQNPEIVQQVIDNALKNGEIVTRAQVMKEIRSAKEELKRQLEEKDKKISELENREPIVKIKEVTPPDYEDMKRSVDNYQKEAIRIQKEKKKMSEKNAELTERIRDLESRKDIDALRKKVKEEAGYFAIRTYKYIQENGGCVWIFQKIDELSDKERKDFIDAIYSADAFIKQMIENLGGYGIE